MASFDDTPVGANVLYSALWSEKERINRDFPHLADHTKEIFEGISLLIGDEEEIDDFANPILPSDSVERIRRRIALMENDARARIVTMRVLATHLRSRHISSL